MHGTVLYNHICLVYLLDRENNVFTVAELNQSWCPPYLTHTEKVIGRDILRLISDW